ncbi:hypothetical protein [Petrotoga halophila]|uniref:Uncharacterized protein n=1 Tax=Petrotoga halophila DSM 16923 TaxID=1122953 RepID=A0A2S5EKA9_9BACT|nr:hypothetical protein [Petrotoga halophila]MDN5346158.1 hypothetical protein [Petrotoga sp.]POZ93547.1 hypothetical protein AA81_01090 [Petrotoga halophila DSM 16923]
MQWKKLTLTFFYLLLLIICFYHLSPFFDETQEELFVYKDKIEIEKSIYYIEINNRYFYFDIYDKITFVSDYPQPKFIKVIFSKDKIKKEEELNFIKGICYNTSIREINFPNKEILCYNNIRIKYLELPEIEVFLAILSDIELLGPGNYFISNHSFFKIDDRGL